MRERLGDYVTQAPLFVAVAILDRAACGGTLLSGAERPDRRILAWLLPALAEIEDEIVRAWDQDDGLRRQGRQAAGLGAPAQGQ